MAEDLNIESQQPEVPVQDKTKVLYDAVSKDYNIGSYDEFSKKLQDPVKRKAFYDGVGNEYNLGSYDEFSSKVKKKVGTLESFPSQSSPSGLPSPSPKDISEAQALVETLKKNPQSGIAKNLPTQKVVYADKNIPFTEGLVTPTNLPKQEAQAYESKLRTKDAAINTLNDIYQQKGLTFDPTKPAAQKQIQDYIDKENNNDLVRVSGKDGKEYLTRGTGFWETTARSLGKSLYDPIESTQINTANTPDDLANLLDQKMAKEPNYPEQAPSKFGGYFGTLAGGLPKMAALLSIPYLGEAAMTTEMYNNAMANQRKELYQRGLQEGLSRHDAAKKAMETAPAAAIPEAVMGLTLARTGGAGKVAEEAAANVGKDILPVAAKKSFIDATNTFGKELAGVTALGGGSEVAKGLIQKQAGYNVTNDELLKNGLNGASEWGLMHAAFNLVHVAPKAIAAAAKNLLSHVPEPILEAEAENHPDGQQTLNEVKSFADTRSKISDFVPEEKAASVTGLTEKTDNLKNDIVDLEEKKKNVPQPIADQIDNQINDKNKEIEFYNNQIKNVIESKGDTGINQEIDDLTGQKIGEKRITSNDIKDFANRISSGEKMESPEDLQFYDNNKKAIEEELKSKQAEEIKPTEEVKPTEVNLLQQASENVQDILGLPKEKADVLSLIYNSDNTDVEKKMLYRQYERGVMNLEDIKKRTTLDTEKLASGDIDKWAKAILENQKGNKSKIDAENIDFEELPKEVKPIQQSELKGINPKGRSYDAKVSEKDGVKYTKYTGYREKNGETIATSGGGREMTWDEFISEYKPDNATLELIGDKKPSVIIHELREGKDGRNGMTITFDYGNGDIVRNNEISFERVEEGPKKTYQEVLKEKQEAEKKQNREFGAEKATRTKEIFRKVDKMNPPEDAEQIALRYLADGGKVSESAINEAYGTVKRAELNTGRKEAKTTEVKSKDYAGGKESIDEIAHKLWEESGQKISERDIKDRLMAEIGSHNSRLEAATAYLERYSPEYQEEQHYARIAEQAKEEFEKEQEELEKQLRQPLDEQIEGEASEEHINNLIEQYEAEIKAEDQQLRSESEREAPKEVSGRTSRKEATVEEREKVEEPSTTSIKNKVTAQERADKGLDEIEVEAKRSFGDAFESGKKMVDEGKIDPRLLAEELVRKPRPLSTDESVALLYDRMKIRNEYQKLSAEIAAEPEGIRKDLMLAQLDQIEKAGLINDEASRKTGYEQGLGLAIRKLMIKQDYTLLNQINQYRLANNGEELSPEIKKRLEENINKLDDAQKKLEEYEQKIKDLEANKRVNTEVKKTRKVNKTDEDFKKEREDIFKNIKDKWDSASKSNIVTAVPVPYSAQLAAISPEVLKLVKSYAEQGITKLEDIVDDLHANISKSIPQITKRDVKDILAGEYTKKKEVPVVDRKKMELQANVNRIKNQIDLEKQVIKRTQRTGVKKVTDYLQKWRRFTLLSGTKVLGKIGLSGTLRAAVTTPIESFIGKGLAKIPGISKIAKGAPREGSTNIKAEAKAFSQFVDKATYRDIKETLKTGRGELEYLHDKKLYPSDGWLDFFGQLHAAIKVLPKRAEYFRSLEIRTQHALENGADITDPIVQQDIAAQSYIDAQRSIYMQDNYVTDLYKHVVRFLENSKGLGKPGAEILKFIFPIIKVPTNYVAEESSYILGGIKALYALRKGVSELTPDEKDYIMRALKKQSIGAAFLALGYANPNVVGGYYSGPRKKGDLEAGDLNVAGVKLPHWMLHTPLLEALQFGATIRRARDQAGRSYKQKDLSMFTGVLPATRGVISQVPFAGGSEQITRATKSKDAFEKYVGGQAQGFIEPQLIKELAEFSDYKNGQLTKRDAQTFMDKLKTGIPGLRQQVKPK